MKYKIGDVARTLGMTPAGLHFFEKENVIEPRKGDDSHRMYDMPDVLRLISYKKYRAMDYPLKDIVHQFSPEGEGLDGILARMDHRIDRLEEKAKWYQALAEDTRWFSRHINQGKEQLNIIDLQQRPETYVLSVGAEGIVGSNRQEQETVGQWLEYMPATRLCCIGSEDGLVTYGVGIGAKRGEMLGLAALPKVEKLPAALALHTFCTMKDGFFADPSGVF